MGRRRIAAEIGIEQRKRKRTEEEDIGRVGEQRMRILIVFLPSGSLYWELDDNRSGKFPKSGRPLKDLGLPEEVDHVDAAFVWPRDNRIYLVVGDQLWRLNSSGSGVEGGNLRMRFNRDSKIGEPIDAAFKDLQGN